MTFSHILKTGARVAVLTLALGGTAMVAMPAQAAGPGFSIQFGNSDFQNYPGFHGRHMHDNGGRKDFRWDADSIQWKLSQTYSRVQYKGRQHGDYFFVGRKGGVWYELRVDGDSGRVWANPIRQMKNGGFNFSFNF